VLLTYTLRQWQIWKLRQEQQLAGLTPQNQSRRLSIRQQYVVIYHEQAYTQMPLVASLERCSNCRGRLEIRRWRKFWNSKQRSAHAAGESAPSVKRSPPRDLPLSKPGSTGGEDPCARRMGRRPFDRCRLIFRLSSELDSLLLAITACAIRRARQPTTPTFSPFPHCLICSEDHFNPVTPLITSNMLPRDPIATPAALDDRVVRRSNHMAKLLYIFGLISFFGSFFAPATHRR